jgi:hypothetical protein
MAQHTLTGELVLRESWSADDGAIQIIPAANTEFAIELSADDGDSVITIPKSVTVETGETVSAAGMKTLCMYGAATVEVSPDDSGATFYSVSVTALTPISICAKRVRVSGAGKVVIQAV